MAKVVGLGGLFFRSPDPEKLLGWYRQWLGVGDGKSSIEFQPSDVPPNGFAVFSPFPENTDYFAPSEREFMFNLIVDDLDGALGQVHLGGGRVVGEIEEHEYGRFGWFIDPDGNKVELWQPPLPGRVGRP
jgi:predicted enzyme related to lactoylglutathione lyase